MSLEDDWEAATPIPSRAARAAAAPAEEPAAAAPPAAPAHQPRMASGEDPSPSSPITAPSPKPLVDITGGTARVQNEIRKGAPGEDLSEAEARAKAVEDAGNPIKDDWIARELVTGTVAGPVVGKVVGAVAPVVRRAASAVADATGAREAGRALTKIAEGASKKLRESLGEVAPEAKELLKARPWLARGRTSADVAKNFADEGKRLAAEREQLFELADANGAGGAVVSEVPVASKLTKAAEAAESRASSLKSEMESLPEQARGSVAANYDRAVSEANALRRQAAGEITAARAPNGPGAPLTLVAQKVDARIARLAKGTEAERAVAAEMEARKASLLSSHSEAGAIPSAQLRRQMSEYQTAYDRAASAAATKADREMSKALGDALETHVGDNALMSQIEKLTGEMSVTTRAAKALASKARAEAAPGGPPASGLAKKIIHDVAKSHGTPNAIAKVGKRLLSPAASAADRALGTVARRMDPAIASIVERGVAEHWGAARLAREIANVQPAYADEEDAQ